MRMCSEIPRRISNRKIMPVCLTLPGVTDTGKTTFVQILNRVMYNMIADLTNLNIFERNSCELFCAAPNVVHFDGCIIGNEVSYRSVFSILFDDLFFLKSRKSNEEEVVNLFNMGSSEFIVLPMAQLWKKTAQLNNFMNFITTNNFGEAATIGHRPAFWKRMGHLLWWDGSHADMVRAICEDKVFFVLMDPDLIETSGSTSDINLEEIYGRLAQLPRLRFSDLCIQVFKMLITRIHYRMMLDSLLEKFGRVSFR